MHYFNDLNQSTNEILVLFLNEISLVLKTAQKLGHFTQICLGSVRSITSICIY